MKIGTLVTILSRGEYQGQLGIVTDVLEHERDAGGQYYLIQLNNGQSLVVLGSEIRVC